MTKSKIDMAWCTISSLSIFCETNLEPELRTRLIQKHWNTEGRQCHRDDGGISGGDCLESHGVDCWPDLCNVNWKKARVKAQPFSSFEVIYMSSPCAHYWSWTLIAWWAWWRCVKVTELYGIFLSKLFIDTFLQSLEVIHVYSAPWFVVFRV